MGIYDDLICFDSLEELGKHSCDYNNQSKSVRVGGGRGGSHEGMWAVAMDTAMSKAQRDGKVSLWSECGCVYSMCRKRPP